LSALGAEIVAIDGKTRAPKHITLNLIRLDPIKRKGGVKARRLIAATSDAYRAELLGLD